MEERFLFNWINRTGVGPAINQGVECSVAVFPHSAGTAFAGEDGAVVGAVLTLDSSLPKLLV